MLHKAGWAVGNQSAELHYHLLPCSIHSASCQLPRYLSLLCVVDNYIYFCQFEWHVCELARAKGTLTIINNLQQKQHEASFWSLHSSQSVTHWVSSLMLPVIQFCNCFLHISIFMEQLGAYKINMLCECYKHGHIVPELKKHMDCVLDELNKVSRFCWVASPEILLGRK